jgi:hypothetical protein
LNTYSHLDDPPELLPLIKDDMRPANSSNSNVPFPSMSASLSSFFNLDASQSIPSYFIIAPSSLASIDPLPSLSNLLKVIFSIIYANSSMSKDPFPSRSAYFKVFFSSFESILIPIDSIAALSSLSSIDPLLSLSNFLNTYSHLDDPPELPPLIKDDMRPANSSNSNVPFPSMSASLSIFFNLDASQSIPSYLIIAPNSFASIDPLPSLSNLLKVIFSIS